MSHFAKDIKSTVNQYGKKIVADKNFLNFVIDLCPNSLTKSTKNILSEIVKQGYGEKLLNLDHREKAEKALQVKSYISELSSYGLQHEIVEYVFNSLCFALGWTEEVPTDPEENRIPSDKKNPSIGQNGEPSSTSESFHQNNTASRRTQVPNKPSTQQRQNSPTKKQSSSNQSITPVARPATNKNNRSSAATQPAPNNPAKNGSLIWKYVAICACTILLIFLIIPKKQKNHELSEIPSTTETESVSNVTSTTNLNSDIENTIKDDTNKKRKKGRKAAQETTGLSTKGISNIVLTSLIENMVLVEGGTFDMGAGGNQYSGAENDEFPVHQVTLDSYYIGKYPVTQKEFETVMGYNPSLDKRNSNLPVENVDWNDCVNFINTLNSKTGLKFRLLSEAEWEFAARGGNKSKGYIYSGGNNIGNVAWTKENSGNVIHPVGEKNANELGIYDMSGNVWEWCQDWYSPYSEKNASNPHGASYGTKRVGRGGSCLNPASFSRIANRDFDDVYKKYGNLGFRIGHDAL